MLLSYFLNIGETIDILVFLFSFFFFFGLFVSFRAASMARGPIGAVAASLHQNHNDAGSELRLQPTPQLTAMLDT